MRHAGSFQWRFRFRCGWRHLIGRRFGRGLGVGRGVLVCRRILRQRGRRRGIRRRFRCRRGNRCRRFSRWRRFGRDVDARFGGCLGLRFRFRNTRTRRRRLRRFQLHGDGIDRFVMPIRYRYHSLGPFQRDQMQQNRRYQYGYPTPGRRGACGQKGGDLRLML